MKNIDKTIASIKTKPFQKITRAVRTKEIKTIKGISFLVKDFSNAIG
jgi:hypothetical protein